MVVSDNANQALLGEPLEGVVRGPVAKLSGAEPVLQAQFELIAVPGSLNQQTQDRVARRQPERV